MGAFKNHKNTKLNELIEKVPTTADPVEKKRIALEAAVTAKNEYSHIAVVDADTVFAVGKKVGDVNLIKGAVSLANILETITRPK